MVIIALDHVPHCYTTADGNALFLVLQSALSRADKVALSFAGVGDVPSSFVNAALVPLLERLSFDEIKRRVVIRDANRQIGDMVKRCFHNATRALEAA
jgi:hypothetical protein